MLSRLKEVLEYLEGASDIAPTGLRLPLSSPWWGLWWGLLLLLILIFSGQTTKFIYVNF